MSNAVFPSLPGLAWDVRRTPMHKTRITTTASGREFRLRMWPWPRYRYTLSYELLRETTGFSELRTLVGFFNQRAGAFDDFLFTDPNDNAVTAQAIGTGNGANRAFQLVRAYGGSVEPVFDPDAGQAVALNGVTQSTANYTLVNGLVTFNVAPSSGAAVTWTGTYKWRVRFEQDEQETSQFLRLLFEARQVRLITARL